MNRTDIAALMKGIGPVFRDTIARSVAPLVHRLVALEAREPERGEKGERGFGLDDFDMELQADGRTLLFKFTSGDITEIHELYMPVMIYRGVFVDGSTYTRGDTVTWAGSLWHCEDETAEKPGDGAKSWRLAAKRGRDGKDAAK